MGVAAYNASRRDPETIARKARAQEEVGNWRRAIALYQSAFGEDKEAKYLLEAARVAREKGELVVMFNQLGLAYAQSPDDISVLTTLLQRYWEIRDMPMGASHWVDVLERADRLLEKEPENTLALASKLEAVEWLRLREEETAKYTLIADETLDRALQIDATNPNLALATAQRSRMRAQEQARAAMDRGLLDEMARIMEEGDVERAEILLPATQANPDNIELRVACGEALAGLERWDQARELLEAGLALLAGDDQPGDPDLHYELAHVLFQETQQIIQKATQAVQEQEVSEQDQVQIREQAEQTVRDAIDLDKIAQGIAHAEAAISLARP